MNNLEKFIYSITKKPKQYVEVKNPPKTVAEKLQRPQDARQLQYNRWSKSHQIYSGSYLPYRYDELIKQGWVEENAGKSKELFNKEFRRKSTGQHVLRQGRRQLKDGSIELTHYHWINPMAQSLGKKEKRNNYYFDKYGNVCGRGSLESHLKPHKTRRRKK